MGIAVVHGLAQALSYAGIDVLGWFPGLKNYYQGLTIHGVFNAIVLTFGFTNGFLSLTTARGLGRKLNGGLLHASFWVARGRARPRLWAMFTGRASVLYTSYAPLQAHWAYYLGLVLLVVSTWITSANLFVTLAAWRREHPGKRIPLLAFVSVGDLRDVGPGLDRDRHRVRRVPAPLVVRADRRRGSAADPVALLVQRPPDRLLLAAPRLRVVVPDGPQARRWKADQRRADAYRLHPLRAARRRRPGSITSSPTRGSRRR